MVSVIQEKEERKGKGLEELSRHHYNYKDYLQMESSAYSLFASHEVSPDKADSLRKIVRKSATDLLDHIGTAQMEKDIEKNVMKIVKGNKKEMEDQTGISTSMTDKNIKEYLQQVIEERQKKNTY